MTDQINNPDSNYFYGLKPDKSVTAGHGKRTAENTCQYMLPALLAKAKSHPNLRILDVGCGPGSISTGLARYIPHGRVTAVDLSSSVLEQARTLADEQKVTNISFEIADIYDLPFKDGTFDVIHTHQTVCHCREPVKAIRELIRVTRKGGIVCMREGDIHSVRFWPDAPLLEAAFRAVARLMERTESGSADAGRRLKAWTVEAGIQRENIVHTAGSWCHETPEARKNFEGGRMQRGEVAEKVIADGFVSRERLSRIEEAWKEWENSEDGVMMMLHGEVAATV